MDISKFKTSDWLKIGGALGFIIFGLFTKWAKLDSFGISMSEGNAFDWFRGWFSLLLIVAVGAITVLLAADVLKPQQAPWSLVQLIASGVATLLMLLLVLLGPDKAGFDFGRGIGLWLSFIATLAALAGSVMGFKESGGNLNDLKDVNKLKSAFGQSGDTPPPAPPAGDPPSPS